MKEVIETIIRNLVSNQNDISVNEIEGEKSIIFEVKVAENDMGKIIGKEGRVAKAIRTVIKSIAAKEGKKVTIEFIG